MPLKEKTEEQQVSERNMVKQTIQIYCRLKPTQNTANQLFEVDDDVGESSIVTFRVPRDLASGLINNKKEAYKFRFNHIFEQNAKQEDIFNAISKPVIENVLSGYNGTIFAYGQTGSGKTFTITGGAERFADRGIIPRSLSYIFNYYETNSSLEYSTHISYLEIYNESGYDLLDPRHEAAKLEDLPKVNLLEDSDGNIHLRNLSVHPAHNEEDALNLLFLGDTNRMIAETPMNQASTRSHCIFTIHITMKDPATATIRRAKLHLVDLAGSERVSKTGVVGTLLSEAKYINLSLHYLEQVIIALSEKSRSHIPYRNSMMTSVLRDSLGGNCMTTMIATCSVEKKNIDESISTCRFAQRVAMIKNDAILNEELDPKLVIERLKREIQQLKDELAMSTGVEYDGELTEEDRKSLLETVRVFLEDNDPEAVLSVGADMRKINHCFYLLKGFYREKSVEAKQSINRETRDESPVPDRSESNYLSNVSEVKKLKELILQRDNEINILVNMLRKEKQSSANSKRSLDSFSNGSKGNLELVSRETRSRGFTSDSDRSADDREEHKGEMTSRQRQRTNKTFENRGDSVEERPAANQADIRNSKNIENDNGQMSVARQEAFDSFKKNYQHNHTIHEQKKSLKEKYAEAKSLGEQVNESRKAINSFKSQIEQQKIRQSMQGLTGDVSANEPDPKEMKLRELLNREKATYKDAFTKLKNLKTEIEHLQHLLEKSKVQMQKDFEIWWTDASKNAIFIDTVGQAQASSKMAWKTPPVTPDKPLHEILRNARASRNASGHGSVDSSSSSKDSAAWQNEYETHNETGRMASKLRAEAHLASSIFSADDPRRESLSQLTEARKHSSHQKTAPVDTSIAGIHLTGDSKTDADIIAFMKARQKLLNTKGRH
ncbi:kinesin-like protein KIF6 [Rhopilema esculentum]|uniref:kinesin-like protein KIF6 n=1 Tax=Rhopilema esculentum TaxID=499914 RepID=UPI0031D04045